MLFPVNTLWSSKCLQKMSLAVYEKLLLDFAERCNVHDMKTLRKSRELISILNSKRSINCSEICKVLICLELAASSTCTNFSRELAVKLSGCSKRNYVNNYNNIAKLLNLDKLYTVKEICLLVGVSHVNDACQNLLNKYKSVTALDVSTLEHPMYACAAVLALCNEERLPLNVQTLVEISRTRKINLRRLSAEFSKLYEKKINTPTKISESILERPSAKDALVKEKEDVTKGGKREMSDEEYREWKRKMLEED